jgi:hypothetical protein
MPPPVNVTNNHTSSSLSANPMTKQKTAPGLAMKEPLLVPGSSGKSFRDCPAGRDPVTLPPGPCVTLPGGGVSEFQRIWADVVSEFREGAGGMLSGRLSERPRVSRTFLGSEAVGLPKSLLRGSWPLGWVSYRPE